MPHKKLCSFLHGDMEQCRRLVLSCLLRQQGPNKTKGDPPSQALSLF
jgi:hypothetical protein